MPYDSTIKAFTGAAARTPRETGRAAFIIVLAAKLNNLAGPYAPTLGLTSGRLVQVCESKELCGEIFETGQPLVYVTLGPEASVNSSSTRRRHQIALMLDLGVRVKPGSPADIGSPTAQESADALLGDCVTHAARNAVAEFAAAGLFMVQVAPDAEAQRAGQGRNPHRVTLWLTTVG